MCKNSKYFRISVTDRCNLSCFFCHKEGVDGSNSESMSIDSLVFACKVAKQEGFTKFKITGGEPTIREDICNLVEELSQIGVGDLSMITNGSMLIEKANLLKKSGLHRLNVTLNTLNHKKFKIIQGGTALITLDKILCGIDLALTVGFDNMKVNFVYIDEESDSDLYDMLQYVRDRSLTLVILPLMLNNKSDFCSTVTLEQLYEKLKILGIRHEETYTDNEGINRRLLVLNSRAKVLLRVDELASHRPYVFCECCSTKSLCREGIFPLRLSADGVLIPCLASDSHRISIRESIEHRDQESISKAIQKIRGWGGT
jgi:GTP 3',8-cyclase